MDFKLKKKLASGEIVLGCFLNFFAPALVEMIGMSGCDFLVLDIEHGSFSPNEMEHMIRAADAVGLSVIVRVDYNSSSIQKALDMGAEGVQVPKVNTKEDAELVVRRAKYPPEGDRGVGLSCRSARISSVKGAQYLKLANENVLVVIQIETEQAVDNIDEILSVPGINVAFLGKMDLSSSVGTAGDLSNPTVRTLIDRFFAAAERHGSISGMVMDNQTGFAQASRQRCLYLTTVAGLSERVASAVEKRDLFVKSSDHSQEPLPSA